MANYYATARSNYFEVKDMDAFEEAMAPFGVEISQKHGTEMVCLLARGPDDGCFPSYDHEKEEEFEFVQIVAPHLKDGWVGIIMEAGAEKMRYIHGHAVAFNNKGEERWVGLNNIYKLGKELGEHVTDATY